MEEYFARLAKVIGIVTFLAEMIAEFTVHEKTIRVWIRCSEMKLGASQAGKDRSTVSRRGIHLKSGLCIT